jgi:hypothetical protein
MSAEFVLDTTVVRAFVAGIQATNAGASSPAAACDAIRPGSPSCSLIRLGFQTSTKPLSETAEWAAASVSGCATARPTDRRRGEEIYTHGTGGLELVEQRSLGAGDFSVLIPPRDDIHRVRTTSAETSVSIHLLTNDTGCVWRHAYDPASGEPMAFRSGYVNVACDD